MISVELALDSTWGTHAFAIANNPPTGAIRRTAKAAAERSEERLLNDIESIREAVERPGVSVEVATRADPTNGLIAPQSELLLMVTVPDLEQWAEIGGPLISARQRLSEHRRVWAVPIRGDALIASWAVKLQGSEAISIDPGWDDWDKDIPAKLTNLLLDAFQQVWNTAVELSAVVSVPDGPRGDTEVTTAEELEAECHQAHDAVIEIINGEPEAPLLDEVAQVSAAIVEQLESELGDQPSDPGGIATEALNMLDGDVSDIANMLIGVNLLLIEYAIDPEAARAWYESLPASESPQGT